METSRCLTSSKLSENAGSQVLFLDGFIVALLTWILPSEGTNSKVKLAFVIHFLESEGTDSMLHSWQGKRHLLNLIDTPVSFSSSLLPCFMHSILLSGSCRLQLGSVPITGGMSRCPPPGRRNAGRTSPINICLPYCSRTRPTHHTSSEQD